MAKSRRTNPPPKIHNQPLDRVHPGLLVNKLGLHAMLVRQGGGVWFEKKNMPKLRRNILEAAAEGSSVGSHLLKPYWKYLREWERQVGQWVQEGRAAFIKARLRSRLAVGVSAAAAMQTGVTLHHTYGVPIIPGSSLKGACRAAAVRKKELDQEVEDLYGPDSPQRGGPGGKSQGRLVFFDALPCKVSSEEGGNPQKDVKLLELDVMTPHHTKYYMGEKGYEGAPDIENPVPVLYLTTPPGIEFQFVFLSMAEDHKSIEHDLDKALEHWRATEEEGLGGMTSSGYGWFKELEAKLPPSAPAPAATRG